MALSCSWLRIVVVGKDKRKESSSMHMVLGRRLYWAIALVALLALAGTAITMTSGLISAGGGDEPISGEAYEKASAAALAHTGGGSVTGTEVGDEDSYYEVEVTLEDGSQVDVQLDESFNVVGSDADDDSGPDDEPDSDD
jgi:hypothetical protein